MPSDECEYCHGVAIIAITRDPEVLMPCLCTLTYRTKEAA